MLLKTIVYDEGTSLWVNDRECNKIVLYTAENHFNEIIRNRGYIYLNQIVEYLGVEWNPDEENLCIKNDGVDRVKFVEFETISFGISNNNFIVHIHQCD